MLASWPLAGRPTTLDLHDKLLLYSARNAGGLFALRVTDGKTTLLGPVQPHDTPQISKFGVAFQSNLYKRLNDAGRTLVKFLPMPMVERAFRRTVNELNLRYPIRAFSMDGARAGVVLDMPPKSATPCTSGTSPGTRSSG